jgi:hypothetical protein
VFARADAVEAKIVAASSVGHFQGTATEREGALS